MSENPLLEAALSYARNGWFVAPIHTPQADGGCSCGKITCGRNIGKHPRTVHGLQDATAEERIIRRWWEAQWPEANIAIVTGLVSGLVVLDIDTEKGGDDSLWEQQVILGKLPATVEAITGGGGRHLLFQHPGPNLNIRNRQNWLPGVDIRGDGGYIVVPPSLHRTGRRYLWEASSDPAEVAIAELPKAWVNALARPPAGRPTQLSEETGEPAPLFPVIEGCAWLRHTRDDAKALSENDWYAMLTIVGRTEGGGETAHEWSKPYPLYDPEETQAKLLHALAAPGPWTCATIRETLQAEEYCSRCPQWGTIKSPLSLGRIYLPDPPPESHSAPEFYDPDLPVPQEKSGAASSRQIPLPHSIPAEKACLGALLAGESLEVLLGVLEILSPPDFYERRHDDIFEAIRTIAEARQSVELVTVGEELSRSGRLARIGGEEYLQELLSECPGRAVNDYAQLVKKKARLRELIAMTEDTANLCRRPEADPDLLEESMVRLLLSLQRGGVSDAVRYRDVLHAEAARISAGLPEDALFFGIDALDGITDGLSKKEVGIICGRPGTGKSSICAQQLHNCARTWGPILYVSLEMGGSEVVRRDLARLSSLEYRALRAAGYGTGKQKKLLTEDELRQVERATAILEETAGHIWIDEHSSSLSKLVTRIHREQLRHGISALIVDYGQLVRDDTGSRSMGKTEEVMRVARAMKREIAVPLSMPVWVAVQANRESEKGGQRKRLGFADLGWSGEWEAVAGRIIFLNPNPQDGDTDEKSTILVDVAKNRHGKCGQVDLVLNGPRFSFYAEEKRYS